MDEPSKFFATGKCEACGHVTDVRAAGCNYMLSGPADVIMEILAEGGGR